MDEVYTVCEDWGEGSGLQIWDTDCNVSDPGQQCKWLHFAINVSLTLTHIADPPLVDMINDGQCCEGTVSTTEEFSFAGVNLTFLLVIIVLSILCINFLVIGISIIIWRWRIFRQYLYRKSCFQKNEKEKKRDSVQPSVQQPVWRVQHWGLPGEERPGPVLPPETP